MKIGDTVELKYQTKPGCLPEIATVLNTWWDHPDFYPTQNHALECKWHKDWHACDCGIFDGE